MNRAYLVAEAGVNHEGNLATCLEMVDRAAEAGCDAFKVQVYDPDRLASKQAEAYWEGGTGSQREFFTRHSGNLDYGKVKDRCDEAGIELCASVFDPEDVGWLTDLVDVFKIASGDIQYRDLLDEVRKSKKPTLLSTGASTVEEAKVAVARLHPWALLHCVLSYPTAVEHVNLSALKDMDRRFVGCHLGYSDHTLPQHSLGVICAAYQLGATVIEKHYTLDRRHRGNDHYHSLNPAEFRQLRAALDAIWEAQGSGGKHVQECEQAARTGARRSLTALADIPAGTLLSREWVTWQRPGGGLVEIPRGAVAVEDISVGSIITESMVASQVAPLAVAV